ncbi:hypothetical protein B0O99DRAFT_590551 [Bisporella sp. PMI_857]|nr:hypothetical protein B0O99DRAFT_590551 [Bisporella sp. PMI_857]
MVTEVTYLISQMSRRKEIPTELHSNILTMILDETPATPTTVDCSGCIWITNSPQAWSASMWLNMLEAGNARSKEGTIRKMLEWIGASAWHDAEVQQAIEASTLTKRGVPRKRVATLVLDKCLGEARGNTAIENPEKLVLTSNENRPSSLDLAKIKRRKRLNNILNTGRMSRKLV